MPESGLIGAAFPPPNPFSASFQTTVVTLDREWSAMLAQALRDLNLPTLVPASPARWRRQLDGDQLNCIIFDLDHGGAGAMDAIQEIAAGSSHAVIVAAASAPTIKTVVAAVRAGAHDFINKRFHLKDICDQVEDAGRHLLGKHRTKVEDVGHRVRIAQLTVREREIIQEIASGLSTKEIARKLDLSPRTVHMFRDRIKRRLDAKSVAEALTIWTQFAPVANLRVIK